jgi:peptide/nickel transport system substrate-binding protein
MVGRGPSNPRRDLRKSPPVPPAVRPAGQREEHLLPHRTRLLPVVLVLTVAVAAPALVSAGATAPKAGGTYRVGWEGSFGFTDSFDPTGEYLTDAFAIYSNLLVRTLVGYDHVAGPAGNRLVPDLATSVPKPTAGGTTYTFHLKKGVRFGPPVSRPVTSRDVLYAFERLARPKNGAQYSFYYDVIAGLDDYGAGKAKRIGGISTPDSRTIVFRLTRPTGDFLYRLAMPATGPIPPEVGRCFDGKPGEYGRNVVSTGPYMIAGSDKLDAASCSKLEHPSGFDGQTALHLVRNPDYRPATDSRAARENFPDAFEFLVNSNASDIADKVGQGELDDEVMPTVPPQKLREYSTDPDLRQYLKVNSGDATYFVSMNLTQPPFDDVHVRRAMNWVADKAAMIQAWGGPLSGKVANHILPDTMFNDQLAEFAPYETPGDHGSVDKAKAAMKGSKYDTKHDGTCSADACKNVLLLADTLDVDQKLVAVLQADAAKIGITFTVRAIEGAFPTLKTTSHNIPIAEFPGWGKDYADPVTFFEPKFDGRTIIPNGNNNFSLVGLKPSQAPALGVKGTIAGIPSVDAQLDRCAALAGQPRLGCYEALDRTLMTKVVPWIPYLWLSTTHIIGKTVTKWGYDQFSAATAYAHVAVN